MQVLRSLRNITERHVRTAVSSALVASADPAEFIGDSFLPEFITFAGSAWDDALGVVSGMFGDLPIPLYESIVGRGITESANYYQQLLKTLVGKNLYNLKEPIFGEFMKGNIVQYGDVRPLLSKLGGGSGDVNVPLQGGITTGQTMREHLRANGIDTDKKIWLYGYEDEPRRTLNGHLQMDGLIFESWEDDGLEIAPQDAWLRRSHYQPGDHWGCACIVAPFIPNFDEAYILNV